MVFSMDRHSCIISDLSDFTAIKGHKVSIERWRRRLLVEQAEQVGTGEPRGLKVGVVD